ncbi:IniB N-terminal domain-containing protein [Rhodococcus sp. NPDC058521]|uniref:IniB N-terminal domain-containing protein n=1 Tax=Rhodococcus sp. NPDC058521 TaxID=3346536 RepID=UPI003663EE63
MSDTAIFDFILDLLFDREAAEEFDADPTGSLSDAGLADISVAEINDVLPTLAGCVPGGGSSFVGGDSGSSGSSAGSGFSGGGSNFSGSGFSGNGSGLSSNGSGFSPQGSSFSGSGLSGSTSVLSGGGSAVQILPAAAPAQALQQIVNNHYSYTDQSVHQDIDTDGGDLTQEFNQKAANANGDGAVATTEDATGINTGESGAAVGGDNRGPIVTGDDNQVGDGNAKGEGNITGDRSGNTDNSTEVDGNGNSVGNTSNVTDSRNQEVNIDSAGGSTNGDTNGGGDTGGGPFGGGIFGGDTNGGGDTESTNVAGESEVEDINIDFGDTTSSTGNVDYLEDNSINDSFNDESVNDSYNDESINDSFDDESTNDSYNDESVDRSTTDNSEHDTNEIDTSAEISLIG